MILENYSRLIDKIDLSILGIIIIIIIIDFLLWKKDLTHCSTYFFLLVMLGIILPSYSWFREIERNQEFYDTLAELGDFSFSFMIFPIYWVLLFLQLGYLNIKPEPVKESINDILDADL